MTSLEFQVIKKVYRRDIQLLTVHAYEESPHGGYSIHPHIVGVVVIHNNHAAIAEVTTQGNIGRFSPIACHGSVSKKSMHDFFGFDAGTKVFAKEFSHA